ncbi:unnamed protein product [Adineta ricciae]|uniref:Prolyl 4-hydroxylase alpha subunit domain-containing protein n=1 Tax=Adineta ricciae TaxID=249248 RepID=A0A815N7F9_ADIRI|nr:unnamed protein product [Adineta ricciae]
MAVFSTWIFRDNSESTDIPIEQITKANQLPQQQHKSIIIAGCLIFLSLGKTHVVRLLFDFEKKYDFTYVDEIFRSKYKHQPASTIVPNKSCSDLCIQAVVLYTFISIYLFNATDIRESAFRNTKVGLRILIEYLATIQKTYFNDESIENKPPKEEIPAVPANKTTHSSEYKCSDHPYTIRIVHRTPLIVYIEKFLIPYEIHHLIKLAKPLFRQSTIYDNSGKLIHNDYRTSWTADIERHETPVVKCIEERFARFQGNLDLEYLEPLQVVKYTSEQEFKPHYDWFPTDDLVQSSGQRLTTFFTYLYSNCSRGETEFLKIPFHKSTHAKSCDILVCDEKSIKSGLRFRPISGNSIFWYNVDEQGKGDASTYHAGRPPKDGGLKIGLNTWTRSKKITPKKRKDVT